MKLPYLILTLAIGIRIGYSIVPIDSSLLITPELVGFFILGDDAESRLASGRKITFRDATIYDLELLPGVSDDLAFRLIESRRMVLESALRSSNMPQYKSLEIIKGIGAKTSAKLGNLIHFE